MFDHHGTGYDAMKSDIWACGVILFIMFAGFPPFQAPKISDWWFHKLKNSRHDLFWRAHCRTVYFSDGFKDLINKILCPDASLRISLEDIRKHDWYNGDMISDQALFAEMRSRKAQVNEKKARERMAKLVKEGRENAAVPMDLHAKERAVDDLPCEFPELPPAMEYFTHAFGNGYATVDAKMGMESGGEEFTPQVYDASRAAAIYTRFLSNCPANELYGCLVGLVKGMGEYALKPSSFKVKLSIPSGGGTLTFTAQVFREPGSARHFVEFKRLSGDGMQFRAIYYMFRDQMANMIVETGDKEEEGKE
jgi:5'-AMP-activated protein kinase catalytic alpha subunit